MCRTSARFVCVLIVLFMLFLCAAGAQAISSGTDLNSVQPGSSPCAEDVCLLISAGDMRLAVLPSGVQLLLPVTPADRFNACETDFAGTQPAGFVAWLSIASTCYRQFTIQSCICHPHQGPPFQRTFLWFS